MQQILRNGISALALGAAILVAGPALAQNNHNGHGGNSHAQGGGPGGGSAHFGTFRSAPAHAFAGHSFAQFSPAQRQSWSGGRWWHGSHGGRSGWWWFVGGGWFFYPYAVYPYPDYVSSTAYYDDYDYAPGYGGGASWYYCDNPRGYYPYVQSCNGPWHPVPMTPPGMQQGGNGYGPGDSGPPPDNGPGPDDNSGPPPGGPNDGPPQGGPDQGPPPPPPGH
jgi:hypothetical protein